MTLEDNAGYLFLSNQRSPLYMPGAQVFLYLTDGSRYACLHVLEQSMKIVLYPEQYLHKVSKKNKRTLEYHVD